MRAILSDVLDFERFQTAGEYNFIDILVPFKLPEGPHTA